MEQTEVQQTRRRLMARVSDAMGDDFCDELTDALLREMIEVEERAVERHGRLILTAIEGTILAASRDTEERTAADRLANLLANVPDTGAGREKWAQWYFAQAEAYEAIGRAMGDEGDEDSFFSLANQAYARSGEVLAGTEAL